MRILERSVTVGEPARGRRRGRAAGARRARPARRRPGVRARRRAHAGARAARLLSGRSPRVSAPLRRMAAVAARVDGGDLEPRMETLGRRETRCAFSPTPSTTCSIGSSEAFAGQREFVADASHELRTPLTVIRGQLEVLAAAAEARRRRGAPRRAARAGGDHAHQPAGRRPAAARPGRADATSCAPSRSSLQPFVAELWDGLSLTAERRFELGAGPRRAAARRSRPARPGAAQPRPQRDRAHRARTDGLVRLEVEPTAHGHDPLRRHRRRAGIPAGERERVFERFHRTDPARTALGGRCRASAWRSSGRSPRPTAARSAPASRATGRRRARRAGAARASRGAAHAERERYA